MKKAVFAILLGCGLVAAPAEAQTRLNSVAGPGPTFAAPFNNPGFTNGGTYYPGTGAYYNPYNGGYSSYPMASPYARGYANPYANPYGSPYAYGYGVPTLGTNGLYGFRMGNVQLNMWRSPSGYYYPWAGLPSGYNYSSTSILYAPQTGTAPQPQLPPISTMIKDMLNYLDEAKQKGTLSDADYQHLRRRATDLQSKEDTLAVAGGGRLDAQDEQSIRADLDQVGKEITERSHRQ